MTGENGEPQAIGDPARQVQREATTTADRARELTRAQTAVRAAIEHAVSIESLDSDTATRLSGEVDSPADVFALDDWVQAVPAVAVQFCRFPGCFEPPRTATGPGKPPAYCDTVVDERGQPAHTAVRSMRTRNRLRSGGPRVAPTPTPGDQANERPVSWARTSVPDLVARVERVVADQQAATAQALSDLRSTVALLGDDEARAAELESVQHDTAEEVEKAKGLRLAAQQQAREARADTERARTAEAEALAAAEEALARVERIEADAAERVEAAEQRVREAGQQAQQQAETDQARVDAAEQAADAARTELDRMRVDATDRITTAEADAEEHKRQVIADRDRTLAERQAEANALVKAAQQGAQQIRDQAEQRVREADQAVARADQAAKDAHAERDRQIELVTQLQVELAAQRDKFDTAEQRHRAETDRVRDGHQAERDRLTEQLRDVTEKAAQVRADLAAITAQREAEQTAHERERQAASDRLDQVREQARADAEQRLADQRTAYDDRLAADQARHDKEVAGLRQQLDAAGHRGVPEGR
jgi:hypothetical protein